MKTLRRMISGLLALTVMLSLPVQAMAMDFDLYYGDVNVTADESGQTTSQPDTNTSYSGYDVTITTNGGDVLSFLFQCSASAVGRVTCE